MFWSSYSLRRRYLAVTALVTLIILTGAQFTQSYVKHASKLRSHNLQLRNEATPHIRMLRNALLDVEKNLDAFLWVPSEYRRDQVHKALENTIGHQEKLYTLEWFKTTKSEGHQNELHHHLKELRSSLDHLMESRIDPDQSDPYLTLQTGTFQPATHRFNEAIIATLQHLQTHPDQKVRKHLHDSLEDIRSEWMRIDVLTEGYGGLLPGQTETPASVSIDQLIKRHQALLASLRLIEIKVTALAGNPRVKQEWSIIRTSASEWSAGLEQLKQLVLSGKTRGDIHFLETNVNPQLSLIWETMKKLEEQLESQANSDVTLMTDIANAIVYLLWFLALVGLVLLAAGFIFFERNILAPITQVAHALRAEAHGLPAMPLPAVQSRETHHLIDAFNEMRQQVQLRQQSLEYLALHDTLTGLSNREQMLRAIHKTLSEPEEEKRGLALLMIGLNRFKEINKSLGHRLGDELLIAVADRLANSHPDDVQLARMSGDEFALLLTGDRCNQADVVAREIAVTLESPFEVENQSLYITATIGIALSPEHGNHPLGLLQKAEAAMHVAKQQKHLLAHYSKEHDRNAMHRLELANALRHELHAPRGALSLVYQPQIEIMTGRFYAMEALLRWNSPVGDSIGAEEIVPIAENTGLIYPLTDWVLEHAFEEYSSLKNTSSLRPVLAVNLSTLNLHDTEFPRKLERLMEKWAIPPSSLQMEITESAMMADPKRAHRTIDHIHAMGIELAIDDFGTGFSSLTYLKHLPVSKLKIDKSFVISMMHDDNDAVIIRSTIDMAHNMGLKVVAEGVESQEIFDLLEILDCDIAQGYHISKPLDIASLEKWIDVHKRHSSIKNPLIPETNTGLNPG